MGKSRNLKSVSVIVLFVLIFSLLPAPIVAASASEDVGSEIIIPKADASIGESESRETPPLVVASPGSFTGNFSPFYANIGYDVDVVNMTQINLLTTDRMGGIVSNAITGEIRSYNGTDYLYQGAADTSVVYDELSDTTTYTAQLRSDLQFSDGVPVTADDIIFTYYTFLDPSYDGTTTLNSYPILGLKEYQTQTTSVVYDKYDVMFEDIYAAGHDHVWTVADAWTQAQQDDVWARFESATVTEAEKIVDYVNANFLEAYAESATGYTPQEIMGNEGMEIMFAMAVWGYGHMDNGAFVADPSGTVYDLVESFPTHEDFKNEILANYNWDIQAAFPYESVDGTDVYNDVKTEFILYWGPQDPLMGGQGIPNIAGVVKVDNYTVQVTTEGFSAPAAYSIFGIPVTPLHYYGDLINYDYENNLFGFDFGDLSKQQSLTSTPLGAGPYVFTNFDSGIVYFSANSLYYEGNPKISEIEYVYMDSDQMPSAIQQGTMDIGEVTYSGAVYAEIKARNSNGEMSGDVITSSFVDNLGYGYIGTNAANVNVGGDPSSEASKNLRRAFGTIFAVHREVAIEAYYGDGASVINYPISNTSWAAPQPTDVGYQIAFSTDINGDPIYTEGMTQGEKYAAAEAAALGFFEAAGYTAVEGVLTAAPAGAKLSYEVIIPADGVGDHPAYGILTSAQASLGLIGMELVINDPPDANVLWDALGNGTQEMWTAAWGSSIDPDMYQVYHSDNLPGQGGTDSNHYHINDPVLDQLIMDARMSDDQAYRKEIYKQCLDIIMAWGVEIPTYQRLNATIYSTERINLSTMTPDMTTYWGWQKDIELLELYGPYGSISGVVTQLDGGAPIEGAWVYAMDAGFDFIKGVNTSSDGSYQLTDLTVGENYYIAVSASGFGGVYYDNGYDDPSATQVAVPYGTDVPNIDFQLSPEAAISGNVYEEDGITPLEGVEITVWPANGGQVRNAYSDSNGMYLVQGLSTGEYVAKAEISGYSIEYFDNATSWGTAAPISVTQPSITSSVNFTLAELPATTPLVVAYGGGSENFSPFFATSGNDIDVVNMTQIKVLTTDRVGGVVHNAISGETRFYNGTDYLYQGAADTSVVYDELSDTTTYTAQLRQDLQFSDGDPVTADDLIFTYYTFLDPEYHGSNLIYSYPILGLQDYQTQTTSEVYNKYDTMFDDIYAAGHDHVWTAVDSWTQAQQDYVWDEFGSAVLTEAYKIVEYVNTYYLDSYAESETGYTPEEISGNEGMEIMFAMKIWGFGHMDNGAFVADSTGTFFDLVESFPTYEDFKDEIFVKYNWDMHAAFPYESTDGTDVYAKVKKAFIYHWGPQDPLMGGEGIPNISGIEKLNDYTVAVTIEGFSPSAVYDIFGIPVAPLHYYGDLANYDYANDQFGFNLGDLSKQESMSAVPMGAGPYRFSSYHDNVVDFVANGLYYKGEPLTSVIQFVPMYSSQMPSAMQQGDIDLGEINYNSDLYAEIKAYNSNGEMTGDVITSNLVDNLGYGYIGTNADTMNVAGDPSSEASKNLRRAFGTIFAVHREAAIEAYYGDGASVINYPISNTSWAAPQPTDLGYEVAFSTDVNGDPIYTEGMTQGEKYAAAEAAALGFFQAAGYTAVGGVLTAAPAGAKLSYEVIIPGDGVGNHPAFGIAAAAMASLANLGMELVINDPADANILWDALDHGTQEMWAAAWGTTIDPDMYQVYHSDNIIGQGGTDSNHYHINDPVLDQLIMEARMSDDQANRKVLYKQILDIIMDWGVEVPTYQRLNATIFSTERVNIGTITPDMTTYWGWQNDIEHLALNGTSVASPKIGVVIDNDMVLGSDWLGDTQISLTIGSDHWTAQSNAEGSATFFLAPFEILPGQNVEMSDGTNSRTYTVVDVKVTTIDETNDILNGTAAPGALEVSACDDLGCETQYPTADGSGIWTVDLDVVDLTAGSSGYIYQYDADSNFTRNYWYIEDPQFIVSSQDDLVIGHFWPANTEITLTIEDNRDIWVGESDKKGTVVFSLDYDILPEQDVEMTDGEVLKALVVAPLEVTEIDQELDTLSGIAGPSNALEVMACVNTGPDPHCETVLTFADTEGNWQADFSGLVDISPGSDGNVYQTDGDEDSTYVYWSVPYDESVELFLPIILR